MKNPVVIPTYPPNYEYPPSDYRNIHGRPSVTVSPKGLTLGTSEYFNDGADFGPDTPGTSTCGIQEAINASNNILLLEGSYNPSVTITVAQPTRIVGYGATLTKVAGTEYYLFDFSGQAGNSIEGVTFDANAPNMTPDETLLTDGEPCIVYDVSSNYTKILRCTFKNYKGLPILGALSNSQIGTFALEVEVGWCEFYQNNPGSYSDYMDNIGFTSLGGSVHDNYLSIYAQEGIFLYESDDVACYGNTVDVNGTYAGPGFTANGISVGSCRGCLIFGNVVRLNVDSAVGIFIQQENDNTSSRSCVGNAFVGNTVRWTGASTNGVGVLIPSDADTNVVNDNIFVGNLFINLNNVFTPPSTGTAENNRFFNNLAPGLGSVWYTSLPPSTTMAVGNEGLNPQGFGLTTPSVPASGTAQANTFPFPVRVYLLTGGTATAYTITDPSGNAETFSVTLTAGLEITLDPGASVTLTYTVAPTWVWYGV